MATQAAVSGDAQSWTRLKQLSSSSSMVVLGFPGGSVGKESTCNAGDAGEVGSILGLG